MRDNDWEDVHHQLADIRKDIREFRHELDKILHLLRELLHQGEPQLSSIAIAFGTVASPQGANMTKIGVPAGFTEGPVTLTVAGQTVQAIVDGYDQFGNSMPTDGSFTMPTATWSIDNPSFATSTPNTDGSTTVAAVASGVANLSAALSSAEGLALTDTEVVTVAIPVTPPPASVLSSVKVAFGTPSASTRR